MNKPDPKPQLTEQSLDKKGEVDPQSRSPPARPILHRIRRQEATHHGAGEEAEPPILHSRARERRVSRRVGDY